MDNTGEIKGKSRISVKNEDGFVLSKDYGFTIEEENGELLAFDMHNHPELGTALLFGNQVFFLKFWTDEKLEQGMSMVKHAFETEWNRRHSND